MQKKLLVVFSFLITRLCAAGIILKSSEPDGAFEVEQAAINIITSCYGNWGKAVAVGGDNSGNLIKTLSSHQIPVVLVDNSSNVAVQWNHMQRKYRYNLHVFAIMASDHKEFSKIVVEIKESVWWNNMASFLILKRPSKTCYDADYLLALAWHFGMINAKVICFDRRSGTWVFGYNPYTTQAPHPWRPKKAYPSITKTNYFTVFQQTYREGKEICKNLNFDIMKNLNGYPVELAHKYGSKRSHLGKANHLRNDGDTYDNVVATIIRVMNGTKVLVFNHNNQKRIPLRDMIIGSTELIHGCFMPVSRAVHVIGRVAMTQHSPHMSQLRKIFSVVDNHSNIGVCIVLVVSLGFFKFFVRQALMPAILNIVRIVCNTGFMYLPQNTPPRIYLTSLLLFAVTMQGIYLGNLASLLTTVVPLPNIDTWQDLVESHHTIYIRNATVHYQGPKFEGRVVQLNGSGDCVKYVLRDSSAVCINYAAIVMDQAETLKLHLSEKLIPSLGVYSYRSDWPLEVQFNIILERLFEADVITPFRLRFNQKTLSDFKFDDDVKNNCDIRVMTLRDLSFAFVILGIGLACASVTFILEIVINRVRSRFRNRRVQFQNRFG